MQRFTWSLRETHQQVGDIALEILHGNPEADIPSVYYGNARISLVTEQGDLQYPCIIKEEVGEGASVQVFPCEEAAGETWASIVMLAANAPDRGANN